MAVTKFQTEVLQRLARLRIDGGSTYVAGGLALNHLLAAGLVSFHEGRIGGAWPRIVER